MASNNYARHDYAVIADELLERHAKVEMWLDNHYNAPLQSLCDSVWVDVHVYKRTDDFTHLIAAKHTIKALERTIALVGRK